MFFEANSSSSIIPNRKSNLSLSLSLSLLFREKKSSRGRAVTAVIGNQGRVRVDRGQTRPSMKPLSTLRALSRQSRPLDSIIDRLNSLFTHRINPPIESRSVYYNNNIRASNRFELRDNSSLVMTARSGNCFQTTVRSAWMETRFRSKKILNVIIQTCVCVCVCVCGSLKQKEKIRNTSQFLITFTLMDINIGSISIDWDE